MTVDLDALEALLAAATPGPWMTDATTFPECVRAGSGGVLVATAPRRRQDASLIAAAVTALPELLRLARVGQAAVDAREAERRIVTNPCRPMPIGDQSGLISEAIAARKRLRLLIDSTRAEAGR